MILALYFLFFIFFQSRVYWVKVFVFPLAYLVYSWLGAIGCVVFA